MMGEYPFFLTDEEVRQLTGRVRKPQQVQWLKDQAIPFRVNATGNPIIVRSAIEGRKETAPAPRRAWTPSLTGA